jgi:cytochrome P450
MVTRPWSRKRRRHIVDIAPGSMEDNPYRIYRWLRETAPVAYAPNLGGRYLVARWNDVVSVLKDDDGYSAALQEPRNAPANLAGSLLFVDGDAHTRMRSAMQPVCQPRRAHVVAATTISTVAAELVDRLEPDGGGDLVSGFFEPLTGRVIASLIGLEDVSPERLRAWVSPIVGYLTADVLSDEEVALSAEFDGALRERVRALAGRTDTQDWSLLSTMLHTGDACVPSEREILTNSKIFAAAGFNELRDLMAHTLLGLLSRPDQLAELRSDPALLKPAVEEGARWSSPVGMVSRIATRDLRLSGVAVPAGSLVSPLLASANRDEARWTDPGRFDVHRDEGMHLAFASGVHFCLGAWLARAAAATALAQLVTRLPQLRLDPERSLGVSGWRFRIVHRLPVLWS